MTTPIITITTDFGLQDHYVGTMKGVLWSRCPDAHLVDITHEIPPFSVYAGAYAIDQAASFFPPGTVHIVVVDPGVGTARKAILLESRDQFFIGPDNGVLSLIAGRAQYAAREIANKEYWLECPSGTFHGRDIFAPVAATVAARATKPQDIGPALEKIQVLADLKPTEIEPGLWRGKVLSVDRFGNVITNFCPPTGTFSLNIGHCKITKFRKTFCGAPEGLVFAYAGSSGYMEIGMNQKNAAEKLQVASGSTITLCLRDTIV